MKQILIATLPMIFAVAYALSAEWINSGEMLRSRGINNCVVHSNASLLEITLYSDKIVVVDDGVGFEPNAKTGLGLTSIAVRADLMKAQVEYPLSDHFEMILKWG